VLPWLAAGLIIGGAVALLLAPDNGEEIRRKLSKTAAKGKKALSQTSVEAIEKGRELYERGRELAEDAAELFDKGRRIAEKRVNDAI
jgi:gas vesicle protein